MTWMRQRNWREKLAKSRSGQSLYEHSLIELDVFLQLAPMLRDRKHYGLSDAEENILMVSLIVHDAGKETDDWQAYVASLASPWVSHILPELSKKLVPEICSALGLAAMSSEVHRVMGHCAGIHHDRPGQSDAAVIEAMLTGASDRFLTLANLVKAIDHLCSANSASEAVFTAGTDAGLQKHLRLTAHELVPRGVSTTLLHRAAQHAFGQAGWKPLLYFATGTVYVADLSVEITVPSSEDICAALTSELETALKCDVTTLMVGSPTGNILPKPELLSFKEIHQYLSIAGKRIGPLSFAKKKFDARRKVVTKYLKLKGNSEGPGEAEVERQSGRISAAQPEMLVFKFFKSLMDPGKIPTVGADGANLTKQKYEARFGVGSWDQLQTTSTLMAADDMANTVDYYWNLPGDSTDHPEVTRVEELPDQTRMDLLVDILSNIACSVFESIGRPSPRDALAGSMAQSFVSDVLVPNRGNSVKTIASDQLHHYRQSKPNAGKHLATAAYLCPICNKPFGADAGRKASADFIEKPEAHTNRGVSHGSFGSVMVCSTCYHERVLRQLLMGHPAEIIAMSPRLNLGPLNGVSLLQKVREWADAANDAKGMAFGFSMSFTNQAAQQVRDHDPFEIEPKELIKLFRYRYTSETQKRRRKEALDCLKEAFDGDLESLNTACPESYPDWETALAARGNSHWSHGGTRPPKGRRI